MSYPMTHSFLLRLGYYAQTTLLTVIHERGHQVLILPVYCIQPALAKES
jgi:hypothetical protein